MRNLCAHIHVKDGVIKAFGSFLFKLQFFHYVANTISFTHYHAFALTQNIAHV